MTCSIAANGRDDCGVRNLVRLSLPFGHVRQILIDGGQFDIVHLADLTPRHLLADLVSVRSCRFSIVPMKSSLLQLVTRLEAGPMEPMIGDAAAQVLAMTFPAILERQDVFAVRWERLGALNSVT